MKTRLKNINQTKKRGILIILIWLSGIFLTHLVEPFRGRVTWIYQYGNLISSLMIFGGFFLSLINTIFLISENKLDLKNNLIWIFISAIPFLYFVVIICIIVNKTVP